MMKAIKSLLFMAVLVVLCLPAKAQSRCEQIFKKEMENVQKAIKEKGLQGEAADAFVIKRNELLMKRFPECFPDSPVNEELQKKVKKNNPNTVKIDSKKLSNQQIQRIDGMYKIALEECKKEMKGQLNRLSQEERRKLVHECIMDKIAAASANQ